MAGLFVVEPSIAAGPPAGFNLSKSEDSPLWDISVEYYANDQGAHQIWLAPKANPDGRVLLFEYQRDANVLMAPNEKKLMINNFPTSSGGEPSLYVRGAGLQFREVPNLNIGDKAYDFMAEVTKLAPEIKAAVDHLRVSAVLWSSNSNAVLLSLSGHGGSHIQFTSWLCVYNPQTGKVSLNLPVMNANAVVHQ